MRKAEYRCNHCMIVESKWFMNDERSVENIACRICGLEANKIDTDEFSRPIYTAFDESEVTNGKVSEVL